MDTKEKEQLEKMEKEMEEQDGVAVSEKPKPKQKQKLKPPNNYQVVFHNDDFTPMEFVVWVLQEIFHHNETIATSIMLDVHKKWSNIWRNLVQIQKSLKNGLKVSGCASDTLFRGFTILIFSKP